MDLRPAPRAEPSNQAFGLFQSSQKESLTLSLVRVKLEVIIFGLGNPGRKYLLTRHNIGFMVLDQLTRNFRIKFRSFPDYEEAFYEKANLFLVKPLLYMNHSGLLIKEYLKKRDDDFLVVCDDIYLPFGEIRFRTKGGDGGHNGLADIIYHLTTQKFPRLRIGIGTPKDISHTDYVLREFSKEEREKLPLLLQRVAEAIGIFLNEGIAKAMTRFNRKSLLERESIPL